MVNTQVLANIHVSKGLPINFKCWIKDVELQVQATGSDDNACIAVATQSASGVIADYFCCFQIDNNGITCYRCNRIFKETAEPRLISRTIPAREMGSRVC